jgi:hypothetical protein
MWPYGNVRLRELNHTKLILPAYLKPLTFDREGSASQDPLGDTKIGVNTNIVLCTKIV